MTIAAIVLEYIPVKMSSNKKNRLHVISKNSEQNLLVSSSISDACLVRVKRVLTRVHVISKNSEQNLQVSSSIF